MKSKFAAFSLVLVVFIISSCHTKYKNTGLHVTGKVGEILVVCDQAIWNSEIKAHLDSQLTQFIMPYFPDVTTFELIHRKTENFDGAIRRHRNILFLEIDSKRKEKFGLIQSRKDVWANRQLVIDLKAKDYNQLLELCKEGMQAVHTQFDFSEWKRILLNFQAQNNRPIQVKINKNFGINLALPDASTIVSSRPNFYRIVLPTASRPIEFVGSGTQDIGSVLTGIMIYQYDFVDSSQFLLDNLLKARDTMLRYNVPHETEGLYMGTQYNKFVFPESTAAFNYNKSVKGIEVRGMFQFTGKDVHSTGGAFWAFHFLHPKSKKLICISGYVDAPSTTSWTHSLREIQAIWKSVEIL
jgi:hypothetical protein